jgi:hypothetical protein
MHNQMELRRFAFYSVGTLPGTSNGLTETRPDTVVARSAGLLTKGKHLPMAEAPRLQ